MSEKQKRYLRFGVFERIEHLVLIISFTTLAATGLPQKYATSPISQSVINFFGGIEVIRIIHHFAAALFIVEAIYHAVMVFYKLYVQKKSATMLPGMKDAMDALQAFGYNLGITKKRPVMPRYNFMEKAEYWAMLWGLVMMALTGLLLWNPIAATNFLPGEIIPAAKAAHGGEAVLAVLAIILWHFYNVHIKHWNWGMIKGTISRHEMEAEHGQELEQIETGKLPQPPAPQVARQRMMIFVPVATIFTLVFVGLTYYFLTFEKTAITVVPVAERATVYVRPTPTIPAPTATALPQAPAGGAVVAYNGGIDAMLKDKCAGCHGTTADFNAESYDEVMKAVTAGSPDNSKIVQVQQAGDHPGQLSADELSTLVNWIQAGAPQGEAGAAAGGASAGAETWDGGIGELFTNTCGTCHGESGAGDFSANTYDNVMKQIQPGDPDTSKVVEVQKAGGHPGTFSDEELTRVINWIKVGAPQQ